MARTYACEGCGARLRHNEDIEKEQGAVYASFNCRYCGTTVPGIVAEKLRHRPGPESS